MPDNAVGCVRREIHLLPVNRIGWQRSSLIRGLDEQRPCLDALKVGGYLVVINRYER